MRQYMVEINLSEFTAEFVALIPAQRILINQLLAKGVVLSYSLTDDRSKLWVVFVCKNKAELIKYLDSFPIINFIQYSIHPLMFHNSMELMMPAISLN